MNLRNELWAILKKMTTGEELSDVQYLTNLRWKEILKEAKANFKVGDKVTFTHPKRGVVVGIVDSIGVKYLKILDEHFLYTVSPTMLKKVDEKL